MSESKGKKRSKSYYIRCAKKQQHHTNHLQPGYRGFLVTYNNNEKQCIRETYQLLNYYGDKYFGPEKNAGQWADHSSDTLDIEDQLQQEIEDLKNSTKVERRFQAMQSGAKNCIFVKTTIPDPCDFAHKLLQDIKATQEHRCRSIFRLLPVSVVCKAYMDDLLKAAEILLTNYFQGTGLSGKTFAILFKVRNNNTLTRQSVISELASLIHQFNSANKADLTSPELAVLVEVICNCCCLSVVPDYFLLKKYNVAELTSHTPSEVKTASSEPVCKNESSQQDASEKIKTEEPKLTDKNTITQQVATVDEDAKAQKPIIASENTTIQEQDT